MGFRGSVEGVNFGPNGRVWSPESSCQVLGARGRRSACRVPRAAKSRFLPGQHSQFSPLPEAVHVFISDLAEPTELNINADTLVGGVFLGDARPKCPVEVFVEPGSWGGDVLEVTEQPPRFEPLGLGHLKGGFSGSPRRSVSNPLRHFFAVPHGDRCSFRWSLSRTKTFGEWDRPGNRLLQR